MRRFILRLLGIKDFEICPSCENLKEQLRFERDEKKRLTDTLINIVSPKVVESAPLEINQIQQSSALFSRRRRALEERDRLAAQTLKQSKNLGMPDYSGDPAPPFLGGSTTQSYNGMNEIDNLEQELGVTEGKEVS